MTVTLSKPVHREQRTTPDWVILTIACVAQFMVVLDVSIVNVALPSIGHDLSFSSSGLQWVVNAYVLTFAGFLLLGGRAADLFGQRRIYLLGIGMFSAASLVGGLAQNPSWLIASRVLQGVGGAFLSPATLTIIVTTYSGNRLARAIGVWSAVAAAGGAAGSLLGGILTAELSWRWILFVNLPIGAVAAVAAATLLPALRSPSRGRRLDVPGAIAVTAGSSALVYGIVGSSTHGWTSTTTLLWLGAGVILLVAFGYIEWKSGPNALIPLGILRSRHVSGANIVMLLTGAVFFSFWYFSSLYMQDILGFSALRTGAAYVPMALAIVISSQLTSRILHRVGARPIILIGAIATAVGFAWFSRADAHSTFVGGVLGPAMIIATALGFLLPPLASTATTGVPRSQAGLASGLVNMSRQMGGSLGLAIFATIATDRTRSLLAGAAARHQPNAALAAGFTRAFAAAGIVAVVGAVVALTLPRARREQAG